MSLNELVLGQRKYNLTGENKDSVFPLHTAHALNTQISMAMAVFTKELWAIQGCETSILLQGYLESLGDCSSQVRKLTKLTFWENT